MKVPYHLRWLPTSVPATALLVPGHRADDVLRVCVELALDPLPPIYMVADGYVLHLPKPTDKPIAGAVRLRGLSAHLLMPVNAELIPPLLADEATALVRKRGLVFLPDARVLEYDPEQPIALTSLVHLDHVRNRPWLALPEPATLADDITEITLLDPGTSPDQVLAPGGAGIGTQDPQLADGSGPKKLLASTLFKLGQGLAKLGQSMNSSALAGLGAKLLGGAMSLVPNLSEKLMGQQEAKLRELLRQFREGNIDKALERALPLGGDPSRGMVPSQNAELPTHPLFYSLVNLLAGGAGGAVSMWFTPDNTYYELLKEYRKQADLAVSRGDFRRAAFIYAKLLNDYHSAAKVLAQGGLHRDAAIVYEKKLHDLMLAAREWQAAGEFDRAIDLYRKMGDHAMAGDLLRRIGEEERAVQEYQIAAAKLLEAGAKHYEAGELLRVRAERPDLALAYYESGWQLRPAGNALSCATRLVQQYAAAGKGDPFLAVVDDAATFLDARDAESTGTFFTEIARLAATEPLAPIADEARDRALMGIARKMTQTAHLGGTLANMLKVPSVWPVPLVGDAQYALTEVGRRPRPVQPTYRTVRAGKSNVTAVCQMPMGSHVFLGFETGEVVCFEPATSAVHVLTRESGPILSLMVDASKTYLVILSEMSADKVCLRVVSREVGYRMIDYYWLSVTAPAQLAIPTVNSKADYAVVWFGNEYRMFSLPNLVTCGSGEFTASSEEEIPDAVIFGSADERKETRWILAMYSNVAKRIPSGPGRNEFPMEWSPALAADSPLRQVPVHGAGSDTLTIFALDSRGTLFQSILLPTHHRDGTICFRPVGPDEYRAFACVTTDLKACVHVKGIDWWKTGRKKLAQTKLTLTNPVAAFPLPDAHELLVVEADGLLTRVPIPE